MTLATVQIQLGQHKLALTPSMSALQQLSEGGLETIAKRVESLEFEAVKKVIVIGLGLSGNGAKELPELIYQEGLANLAPLCIHYLNILANGGRMPPNEEAMAKTGD